MDAIRKICVIGAGPMGAGIADIAAVIPDVRALAPELEPPR